MEGATTTTTTTTPPPPRQQQQQGKKDQAKPQQELKTLKTSKASRKQFNPPEKEYLHTPFDYEVPFITDHERIYALDELLGLLKWCGGLSNKSNKKRKAERYGKNSMEKFLHEDASINTKDIVRKRIILGVDRCLEEIEKGQLLAAFVCMDPNPSHLTEHLVMATLHKKILIMPFCLEDYKHCSNHKLYEALAIGIKHSHISGMSHPLIIEGRSRFDRLLNIMDSIVKGKGIPKEKEVKKEEAKEEVKVEGEKESKEEEEKEEPNEHKEESTEDNSKKEKNKGNGKGKGKGTKEPSDTHSKPQYLTPVIRKEGKKRVAPTTTPNKNDDNNNNNNNNKNSNKSNKSNNNNKKPKTS